MPNPKAKQAICKADVALLTAKACLAPVKSVNDFSNAGVINFSNPLDMGDIYDPQMYAHITYELLHNDNVDALIYTSQWPHMPKGINVFYSMFQTDLSKESIGSMLSADKPLGVCLFGLSATIAKMKVNSGFPLFNSIESMIRSFKYQSDYYAKKFEGEIEFKEPEKMNLKKVEEWLSKRDGVVGEDTLELLSIIGINVPNSDVVSDESGAVSLADKIGYPVVMKIISPDAVHKSDAGGVLVGLKNAEEVKKGFVTIKENLFNYKKNAEFTGVRVMAMADDGYDMFIGGNYDEAFGPAVFFGMGGVTIEVFKDVENVLAPSFRGEIASKVKKLKSFITTLTIRIKEK